MKFFFLPILFALGCSLSGCAGELKAAKAGGGSVILATITVQCEQTPDAPTCTVAVSAGDAPSGAGQDDTDSKDGAGQ